MPGRAAPHVDFPPGGWPIPKSAYVHVPFCRHRCGYCNFSVIADRDDLVDRFLTAIDRELSGLDRPPIKTLFVGGGTPTHLSPDRLARFLALLQQRFQLQPEFEWSVEANPEDITPPTLDVLTAYGVNRISLGVQSFDTSKLNTLERSHSGREARNVVQQAAEKIENVSIDLIFAAPGESMEGWQRDIEIAMSLPVTHLSTYALTVEKGTTFWSRRRRGDLPAIDDTVEIDMYQHTRATTAAAGLEHYEISNFAKPGYQCRHNLAYWHGHGWYAAGPGAARFVDGRREVNHRSTTTYLNRMSNHENPVAESDAISTSQFAREKAAFGIRMIEGIDLDQLSNETGIDLPAICGAEIGKCIADGLLSQSDARIRLTDRGVLFADTVASALLA